MFSYEIKIRKTLWSLVTHQTTLPAPPQSSENRPALGLAYFDLYTVKKEKKISLIFEEI
jgi:hypothetical protein